MSGDDTRPGALTEAIGQAMGENRALARKGLLEAERKANDAKLAALEERLKSSPGKLPVVKSSWQPESVTYQAELVAHKGSLWQRDETPRKLPAARTVFALRVTATMRSRRT